MKSHHTSNSSQYRTPRSLADSYLHLSEQRMTTAAASLAHQSTPNYSIANPGYQASPLAARKYRSGSLSSPGVELLDRRQRANSYSESPVTGHSSPQLDKREYSIPKTIYGSPSPPPPPMYHSSPVVAQNFERLLKQDKPINTETYIRHRRSNSDVSHRVRSPSPSPQHGESQTYRAHRARSPSSSRRHSESQTLRYQRTCSPSSSPQHTKTQRSHRARSPSPSPQHSTRQEGSSAVQSSNGTLSDARQRRAAIKKQENAATSSTIGDSSTLRNRTSLDADQLRNVSSNLDSKEASVLYSSSRGNLRRSNSTSSVADCLKWEGRNERKSSPETLMGNTTKVLSSRGSFDGIHKIGLTGGENHRKKSPKSRIRSLLKCK